MSVDINGVNLKVLDDENPHRRMMLRMGINISTGLDNYIVGVELIGDVGDVRL